MKSTLRNTAATLPAPGGGSARGGHATAEAPPLQTLVVTEAEAARILRLSPRSLQRLRLDGGGPPFCRLSERRIGYVLADLTMWLSARTAASTSSPRKDAA